MGDTGIHTEATQLSEDPVASYRVILYSGKTLLPRYVNMIYSKWMRSLRYGNDYFKLVDSGCYYRAYQKYISHILSQLLTEVRLAVLTDDPDIALGFSVAQKNVLHYVYVHRDYRKFGIASNLVSKDIDTITHVTKIGLSIWGSKFPNWKFNPFI